MYISHTHVYVYAYIHTVQTVGAWEKKEHTRMRRKSCCFCLLSSVFLVIGVCMCVYVCLCLCVYVCVYVCVRGGRGGEREIEKEKERIRERTQKEEREGVCM
jgi:hypothetical protein